MTDRTGIATINGTPLTVGGTARGVGDSAPDVKLHDGPLSTFSLLKETTKKIRVISVVLCIDTGVCEAQTKWLDSECASLGEEIACLTISTDLPETQFRWAGMNGVENVTMLSDHFAMEFGEKYGTALRELRKDQRAIFVVDANDVIRYVEYVPETGHHIDYEGASQAVQRLLKEMKEP